MANKLVSKIVSTFEYICSNNRFSIDDPISITKYLDLIEVLSADLGIIDIDTGQGENIDQISFEKKKANKYINYQFLSVAIENDPIFIKEKNTYLLDLKERFEPEYLMLKNLIPDYDSSIKKIKNLDGSYSYSNKREKAVMLIELISESVFKTIKELDTNPKSTRLTHPQQMLLLDKLNIIDDLSDKIPDLKSVAELIAIVLNRDKDNTRLYLTYGTNLSDTEGSVETQKKYNYNNVHHLKIVNKVLSEFNL